MFNVYQAYNYTGGDGKCFLNESDAIAHTKGKSDYGGDGHYWAINVYEPSDLTPEAKLAWQKEQALSKLTDIDKKVLGLE